MTGTVAAEVLVAPVPRGRRSRIRSALTGGPFTWCRFAGMRLRVGHGVFVPTPFTERLVDEALRLMADRDRPVIVDVGTGCGAVALALARARPDAEVHGTDLSPLALRSARFNRRRLGLRRVRLHGGPLLLYLPRHLLGHVTAVVGNVPYIPPALVPTGRGFMPPGTYEGTGEEGLGLVEDLARQARGFLETGGRLVVQVADAQWEPLSRSLGEMGYADVRTPARRGGGAIVVSARWPGGTW